MWYVTTYQPVSFVSLKLATATSTGGKSLLWPTPFAIRMALLDTLIKDIGLERGQSIWPVIRDANLALRGPKAICVNNTFTKILKPVRGKPTPDPDTGLTRTMSRTIAFREYVQWQGELQLAFDPHDNQDRDWARWLTMVNYLGKRGGFVQATSSPTVCAELSDSFTYLAQTSTAFTLDGTLQILDDCAPSLTFEQVDIYSSKNMRLDKDRILRNVVIPYQIERSSRGYTLYKRIG